MNDYFPDPGTLDGAVLWACAAALVFLLAQILGEL